MKFDKFYKLVVNESQFDNPEETSEFDELKQAISGESEPTPTPEAENGEEHTTSMPETPDEQIAYLVRVLPLLSKQNSVKSDEELHKMATDLINDDLFEIIYNAHEELKGEPVAKDDLPEDLKTDKMLRGPMGDEPDVPGLTEYEKEQRAMDRYREEEAGIENRED